MASNQNRKVSNVSELDMNKKILKCKINKRESLINTNNQAVVDENKKRNSIFANFKYKFRDSVKSLNDSVEDLNSSGDIEETEQNEIFILRKAYFNLLYAVLDPTVHVREMHTFQHKTFTIITTCDECHSVLWGIHKQGLMCTKCNMCIHEKCQEVIQEDCGHQRYSKNSPAKNNTPMFIEKRLALRYEEVDRAYPFYFQKLKKLFKYVTSDMDSDVKLVQKDYIDNNVKKIKTKLKIFVKNACNLIAKDSNGASDPYVTIQVGHSKIKRTKTIRKNLNPVWNEYVEFEYFNTTDGICNESGKSGDKIIVRVWDEDFGIAAQVDKMLTNEADDFLGQIVLDINDLNLNVDQSYTLKPRTDNSLVTGYIILRITLKVFEIAGNSSSGQISLNKSLKRDSLNREKRCSYLDQYRCLHRHFFRTLCNKDLARAELEHSDTKMVNYDWLLSCIPVRTSEPIKINYFKDHLLNFILKQFSNKYVINELQKQMIHLECFYMHFIDAVLLDNLNFSIIQKLEKDSVVNCKIFNYMTRLIESIEGSYSFSNELYDTEAKNISSLVQNNIILTPRYFKLNITKNKAFFHQTCLLPNKIILLLRNYRYYYPIGYRVGDGVELEGESSKFSLDELTETISLFKACCDFVHKNLELKCMMHTVHEKKYYELFDTHKLKEKYSNLNFDLIFMRNFSVENQLNALRKCIEVSLILKFNSYIVDNEFSMHHPHQTSSILNSTSSSLTKLHQAESGLAQFVKIQFLLRKVQLLMSILTQKLFVEIELNDKYYFLPFSSYPIFNENEHKLKTICTRILIKKFMCEIFETIRNDKMTMSKFKSKDIKLHLNLYLYIKTFLNENKLDELTLQNLMAYSFFTNKGELKLINEGKNFDNLNLNSLSELFQPFLLEFLREQEDQFIRYIHKIYDADRLFDLASEMANAVYRRMSTSPSNQSFKSITNNESNNIRVLKLNKGLTDLENYCSPSVTDLFSILHELLQTVLLFNSNNPGQDLVHIMCYINLVKSKLLAYSAHVKKEYYKMFKKKYANEERSKSIFDILVPPRKRSIFKLRPSNELTIASCILINNFKRTRELLHEIKNKICYKTDKVTNLSIQEQLESLDVILEQDLNNMIIEYAKNYQKPLTYACKVMQIKLYENKNGNKSTKDFSNLMNNLIDELLYDMLNDKLIICKTILFEPIFKKLLEEIFKISVRCIEDSIILKRDVKLNSEGIGNSTDYEEGSNMGEDPNCQTKGLFEKFNSLLSTVQLVKLDNDKSKENSLLNQFQFKIIDNCLKHILEFFSADEECLNKQYLIQSIEFNCAQKTLNLYLLSSNQLMSNFIKYQNMQQNNIDFSKTFGKIRFQIEIKQNLRNKHEFGFSVRFIETRDVIPSFRYNAGTNFPMKMLKNTFKPSVEVYGLGPCDKASKRWNRKVIGVVDSKVDETSNVFYFKDSLFEFKINLTHEDDLSSDNEDLLENYEIQIILNDLSCTKKHKIIGMAVLNLNEVLKGAKVWKRLKIEDEYTTEQSNQVMNSNLDYINSLGVYGKMDLWLGLRARLKINEDGSKILKVLDRHVDSRLALEFIQLKLLSRIESDIF